MWFLFTPFILLFTISSIKSREDAIFSIEEIYNEVSNLPQLAKNLQLESELLNGKVTSMELVEKLLGRKIDETSLDEYSKMDISNGIKEQNELMDLFEKAKKSEVNDQMKKDIGDGLNEIEGMSDVKSQSARVTSVLSEVDVEVKETRKIAKTKIDFPDHDLQKMMKDLLNMLKNLSMEMRSAVDSMRVYQSLPSDEKINMIQKEVDILLSHLKTANSKFDGIVKHIESKYDFIKISRFGSINSLMSAIEKLSENVEKMKNFNSFLAKLPGIVTEFGILEKFRDDQTRHDVTKLMKKLKKDHELIKGFKISKDVLESGKTMEAPSQLIEKLTTSVIHMNIIESIIYESIVKLEPLEVHLENLKIPAVAFTEKLNGLKTCFEQYDFAIELTTDSSELKAIVEVLRSSSEEAWSSYKQIYEIERIENELEDLSDIAKTWNNRKDGEKILEMSFMHFDYRISKMLSDIFEPHHKHPEKPDEKITSVELSLYEGRKKFQSIPLGKLDELEALTKRISTKVSKIEQLLNCYTELNVVPSDIKSLIDLPKETWNFDPILMENALDVVALFKEAYKTMDEMKNWKFDSNQLIDKFPLDSEDVERISDGFESLKSIQNIQNNWIKMTNLEDSQIEESNVRGGWNEVRTSLENLMDHLSHMETHSELSDFQSIISTFQVPSDLPIDPIVDFIKLKYKGNDRNGILNILKDVKNLQKDFSSYSAKLQKMNESIEKLKKWMEKPEKEELIVDCFANPSCDKPITLPEAR